MSRGMTIAALALAVLAQGCITVSPFTPGSDGDKGMWMSKGRSFGPLQLSDPEILYCTGGSAPVCNAAKQNSALSGMKVPEP